MNPYTDWRGKMVFLYTLSGAKYGGELHPYGEDRVALRKLQIWCEFNQDFATVISKSKKVRKFKVDNILKVEAQE